MLKTLFLREMNLAIDIKSESALPKYRQLADGIVHHIKIGNLKPGQWLPSLTEMSLMFDLSRDTVERAYTWLRNEQVIKSVPNMGHFVTEHFINDKRTVRILLLLNKLSEYKKVLYNALLEALEPNYQVDLHVFNNKADSVEKVLQQSGITYQYFICICTEQNVQALQNIPKQQLIVLDKLVPGWDPKSYTAVYQDYENDLFDALETLLEPFTKYDTLICIFPEQHLNYNEVHQGLRKFGANYGKRIVMHTTFNAEFVKKRTAFLVIHEADLSELVTNVSNSNLKIGQDVGVLSYNESPLKKAVAGGITVLSTDFEFMGKQCASLCKDFRQQIIRVPFKVYRRTSF